MHVVLFDRGPNLVMYGWLGFSIKSTLLIWSPNLHFIWRVWKKSCPLSLLTLQTLNCHFLQSEAKSNFCNCWCQNIKGFLTKWCLELDRIADMGAYVGCPTCLPFEYRYYRSLKKVLPLFSSYSINSGLPLLADWS